MNRARGRWFVGTSALKFSAVAAATVLFIAIGGRYSLRWAHADEPSDPAGVDSPSSDETGTTSEQSSEPASAAATADAQRIVGTWKCQTEEDGTLVVRFTADGQLVYQFTGGDKDHNYGTYQIHDQGVVLYTPHDEPGEEHWTYGFDSAGKLKLKMEQDDPKNAEQYTMSRARTRRGS
jgi:hypothetical protein